MSDVLRIRRIRLSVVLEASRLGGYRTKYAYLPAQAIVVFQCFSFGCLWLEFGGGSGRGWWR